MTIRQHIQRAARELAVIRADLRTEAIEADRKRQVKISQAKGKPQAGDAAIVIANTETVAADAIIITHHHH